jgi:outer membrane protein assembly factor BamB
VVDGNTLYFGDLKGSVFSVTTSEGKVNWKQQLGSAVRGVPVVVGDKLFVIAEDGLAFALKTSDGSTVWKKSIDDENADRLLGNPVVVSDLVVIAPIYAKNWLYALNINDGTTKWFFKP